MKYLLILLIATIWSCSSNKDKRAGQAYNQLSNAKIDSLTHELDKLIEAKLLAKYFHPNMSSCGGGLYGYYSDTTLLMIDAIYQAELGYSRKKIYWNEDEIIKIIYQEHFAEWRKYQEKFPPKKYEWDPSKMTYTDTVYQITFGKDYQMLKTANKKLVSESPDSRLIERLVDCGFEMRNELKNEKKLKE